MTVFVLAAKAAIAVLLIAAGGAKLADPVGFTAAIRLFVPPPAARRRALVPAVAAAVIAAELVAGAVSLCWPAAAWANLAVLVLACGFTVVAGRRLRPLPRPSVPVLRSADAAQFQRAQPGPVARDPGRCHARGVGR